MASVGLAACAPLLGVIALLVKLTSPGPVFYRSERVGRHGEPFRLYKFRSMYAEASGAGPRITRSGDPRITALGRYLRRLKLDELPQLFNVVRGDLSLVGPRPEDPKYVAKYTREQLGVLSVRPGITSIASIRYRDEESLLTGADWETTYVTVVLPDKLRLELEYLDRRTLASDLGVVLRTLLTLFR